MSHKRPNLPKTRFEGQKDEHVCTKSNKRSNCKYCSFLKLQHKAKNLEGTPPTISNIYRKCSKCDVFLCAMHFDLYHTVIVDESDEDESEESSVDLGGMISL